MTYLPIGKMLKQVQHDILDVFSFELIIFLQKEKWTYDLTNNSHGSDNIIYVN